MKNITQIVVVTSIIIWLWLFVSFLSSQNKENVEINRELASQNKNLKQAIESEKAKMSTIESIKHNIDVSKSMESELRAELDQRTLEYQARVWQTRCLTALWQLELINSEHSLECRPYTYNVIGWFWEDDVLDNLWRFSAENLDNTLIELGLK